MRFDFIPLYIVPLVIPFGLALFFIIILIKIHQVLKEISEKT
jgi:TRAP-type C4-dicarboxylate transport system permease small subunit